MPRGLDPLKIVLAVQCAAHDIPGLEVSMDELRDHSITLSLIVKKYVHKATRLQEENQPEWRGNALEPIVANFPDDQNLSMNSDDTEYVLLVCTTVLLVFEIFLQRDASLSAADEAFIDDTFHECFEEPKMLAKVSEAIELEYERLAGMCANMNVLSALWLVGARLSDVALRDEPQKSLQSMKYFLVDASSPPSERNSNYSTVKGLESPQCQSKTEPISYSRPVSVESVQSEKQSATYCVDAPSSAEYVVFRNDTNPSTIRTLKDGSTNLSMPNSLIPPISDTTSCSMPLQSFSPLPSLPHATFFNHDVLIHIHLKPNCTFRLDFVSSVNLRRDIFTLKTCTGLSLLVEEGVTVSEPSGGRDTCFIRGNGSTGRLSATLAIPAERLYTILDVMSFEYVDQAPMTSMVETENAKLYIGNGVYKVEEDKQRGKIVIRNK